jgi:hypothetical protein
MLTFPAAVVTVATVAAFSKHAPLRSISVVVPGDQAADSSMPTMPARSAGEQRRLQQRQQQQQQQDTRQSCLQVLDWLPGDQQQPLETGALHAIGGNALPASSQQLQLHMTEELVSITPALHVQQQQQQQHGIDQAEPEQQQGEGRLLPGPEHQLASSITADDAAHLPLRRTARDVAAAAAAAAVAASSNSRRRQPAPGEVSPASIAQPKPLYRLIAAARRRGPVGSAYAAALFDELQPMLPFLPFEQLAEAAWAAAAVCQLLWQQDNHELSALPSATWQQSLLNAASNHFVTGDNSSSSSSSSSMSSCGIDETPAATLLQAVVKLPLSPSKAWLCGFCQSLAVGSWSSGRALSTVVACLAQLGYVPSSHWLRDFFATSASSLATFPAISLARMFHGVVAWQVKHHLQQQDEGVTPAGEDQLLVPSSWLLKTLHSLCACSSQLKPPELAMVLQAMQQLQQQQMLLPLVGLQPCTPLQHVAVQLQDALMTGVLQQLRNFGGRDLTVTMRAVAMLQRQQHAQQQQQRQQQQQLPRIQQAQEQQLQLQQAQEQLQVELGCVVSWWWLHQVLGKAQVVVGGVQGALG